jgi:hypothetical protein
MLGSCRLGRRPWKSAFLNTSREKASWKGSRNRNQSINHHIFVFNSNCQEIKQKNTRKAECSIQLFGQLSISRLFQNNYHPKCFDLEFV